jgi:lipopolysaccharide biosynthesis protein
MDTRKVDDRESLLDLIFDLLDENDSIPWKNDTAYAFLATLAEWLDEKKVEQIDWQMLADALVAARGGYETE